MRIWPSTGIGRAGAPLVVDRPRRDDRVLAPFDEPLLGQVERDRHRLEERVGDLGDRAASYACHASRRCPGSVGPHVRRVERPVPFVVLAVGVLAADVERLEQVAAASPRRGCTTALPARARCSRGWPPGRRRSPRASRRRGGRRTRRTRRARRRTSACGTPCPVTTRKPVSRHAASSRCATSRRSAGPPGRNGSRSTGARAASCACFPSSTIC